MQKRFVMRQQGGVSPLIPGLLPGISCLVERHRRFNEQLAGGLQMQLKRGTRCGCMASAGFLFSAD